MGLSNEEYNALCSGSDKFFTISSYGFDDVKAVMQLVFGSDRSSDHALAWTSYWERVFPLAEQLDCDEPYTAPDVPPQFGSDDVTMTDAAPSGTPVLSISLDGQADRQEVKKLGKSFDTLVAALVIERSEKNSVGDLKPIYHCLGCDNSWRNNSRTRCGPHLIACPKLQRDFPDAWEAFRDSFSNASASNVLTGKAVAPPVREKSRKAEDPNHDRVAIPGIATASTKAAPVQRTLGASWGSTEKMTAPRQRLLFLITDFHRLFCSSYSVPDRSSFVTSRLAIETTYAMEQLQAMVQSFIHLTLSFDGWSSRRKDEIYTTHVTTPACLSYLVAGIILTGISATGDKICEELTKVILFYSSIPQSLNLLAKEIMVGSKEFPKIKGFTEPMKFVSLITTFFSHSNDSTKYLRDELKTEEDRRSLVAFGETRFSTFANQASSVSRCFNAIQSLFERGQVKFDTKAPTDPKRVRIPTLDDLLNPTAPTDSDAPIDLDSVEDMADGEDETDIDAPPLVQRVANLPVLEIETYIGLKAPKLTQRFGPKQMDIRTALSPQKPKAAKAPWNAGSSKWDARKW
ncbi:hypothetical protein R3P38DRAFT_3231852 [Favolaschia claudopus]|uniref:Uncharacterized protein n=1 Tax=Favolaschia claudopus TaxID=2862362 RepID=A0AAV9ZJM9_9AGAR